VKERLPLKELFRVPAYIMLLVSASFSSFAGYSYVAWGPDFVQEYKGFSSTESGVTLGLTVLLAGGFGILAGATISDWFSRKRSWGRSAVVPVGFVLAAPCIFYALHASTKPAFIFLFGLGTFFLTWYHGPVTATIQDIIPSQGHATAWGFYSLIINLLAMAIAPLLIGTIADQYGLMTGLESAIVFQLIGGLLFLYVPYFIRRDGLHHNGLTKYWQGDAHFKAAQSAVTAPTT
jgi:MFS family permease